jgi:LCP family protein required for cell wall assembly
MQPAHAPGPRRSAFTAGFLSLLFPGLGHAYLGLGRRALAFAAPPILIGALVAGIAIRLNVFELAGLAVQSWFLTLVFVVNLVAMVYRAAAIVDAWRIAAALGQSVGRRGAGRPSVPIRPAGIAGLAAILLVMSVAHVAVARYDLVLSRTADCIFDPNRADCSADASPTPDASGSPGVSASPSETPTPEPTAIGTPVPEATIPPWDGKERLNILLIGSDEQGGGHNTDTLIVVSVDPTTGQVAMFSLPRDTVDVPIPAGTPARAVFGPAYASKINSFFVNVRKRADLYPGTDQTRGYNALKSVLGNLYGLDVKYFVEVNFDGFRKIVDALGGVTINVQIPVVDDRYPTGNGGPLERVYIPVGMQQMTADEALTYARSRNGSSDFDRAARQQRVLVSIRQQTDVSRVLPKIDELAAALSSSIRTDIPRELLPRLLGLADQVDTRSIRSYVFTPPLYQTENQNSPRGYILEPNVARIRAAVKAAFTSNPSDETKREALAAEGASVWVLNGSGKTGAAANIAGYLEYVGIAATAPNQKPDISGYSATTLLVYNGAEQTMPETVAALESIFGVSATLKTDPAARVDIAVVTGKTTPDLTPPPAP